MAWLWALWLSLQASLAAQGCLVACERATGIALCCTAGVETTCPTQPCECEPCPVCHAPTPTPAWAEAKPLQFATSEQPLLVDAPALPLPRISRPLRAPEPFPNSAEPVGFRAHPFRAPPVLG